MADELKLTRTPEAWAKVSPQVIAEASPTAITYLVEDAQYDIARLAYDRNYWKVEAEGERAKVARRDAQLTALRARVKELEEGVQALETVAAQAHRHRGNKGKEADFLAVIEDRARTLLKGAAS